MWSDSALGERIAKDFVTVMVDVDKDEATAKQYGVSAMPTLVVADAKEKVLVKQVGAPFSTVADATKWFDNIASALKDVADLEAKHAKNAKDLDVSLKLADTYVKLSRHADAVKLFDDVLAALPKDDKRILDIKLKLSKALLEGEVDAERGTKLSAELTETFLKAKDERAMDTVFGVMMGHFRAQEFKEAREALLKCVEAFPKHTKALEYRFYAAYLAGQAGDKDTAKKELKSIIEAGPADSEWVTSAKQVLEELEKEGSEGK